MSAINTGQLRSPIKKQRVPKTKKAKNTLTEPEKYNLARRILTALLLERFVKERTNEKYTPDFLAKTKKLLYTSVGGMHETDTEKLKELKSKMKMVAAMLNIRVRSSIDAMLVDFEDSFFGENYRTKFDSIYKRVSDEDPWPHEFFTAISHKFDDTNDTQPCMILGAKYKTEKYRPNSAYCSWWRQAATQHRDAINAFMKVTAPASPPSAPASAPASPPSTPASAPAEPELVQEIMIDDISEDDLLKLDLPGWDKLVFDSE